MATLFKILSNDHFVSHLPKRTLWGQRRDRTIILFLSCPFREYDYNKIRQLKCGFSTHQLFLNAVVVTLILRDGDDGNERHLK